MFVPIGKCRRSEGKRNAATEGTKAIHARASAAERSGGGVGSTSACGGGTSCWRASKSLMAHKAMDPSKEDDSTSPSAGDTDKEVTAARWGLLTGPKDAPVTASQARTDPSAAPDQTISGVASSAQTGAAWASGEAKSRRNWRDMAGVCREPAKASGLGKVRAE